MRVIVETSRFGASSTSASTTVNAAFLHEIKHDNVHFQDLLEAIHQALTTNRTIQPRVLAELLSRLRDEIETHFTLEEFFGYFDDASTVNPEIGRRADTLKGQHESLYLELNDLVDDAERLLYREAPIPRSAREIIERFQDFYRKLKEHDEQEMELIMRLCNEDIGVGD